MRALTVALTATAVLVPASVAMASHSHHQKHWDHAALWASPTGTGTACTYAAPCSLSTALGNAAPRATVRAMSGTYTGGVVIDTKVNLAGQHGAELNAATSADGVGIQVTAAGSGSSVRGFTVENAPAVGILVGSLPGATSDPAAAATKVNVSGNKLLDNGTLTTAPGWGIWLVSATNSTVANNQIKDNGGGIYLTDENGPNDHNRVVGNRSIDNTLQCGITLAGHLAAVDPTTLLPTGAGGVFDNLVANNVSNGNGTYVGANTSDGDGAGILMGGGVLGAAVYGNVVRNNSATGNGLAGVVIHQHAPGDLNNNVIVGNRLGKNNVLGDTDFTTTDTVTTGILVASAIPAGTPGAISGTVIARNSFRNNAIGIWTLNVSSTTNTIAHNRFAKSVTTPIVAN
jgi:parallel beta-helix repeat protein